MNHRPTITWLLDDPAPWVPIWGIGAAARYIGHLPSYFATRRTARGQGLCFKNNKQVLLPPRPEVGY